MVEVMRARFRPGIRVSALVSGVGFLTYLCCASYFSKSATYRKHTGSDRSVALGSQCTFCHHAVVSPGRQL